MALLPIARNRTYVPGVTPVAGNDINDLMDCVIGHKFGPTWFHVPLTPILATQVVWTAGFLFSNATPNGTAVIPLATQRGCRIYEWRFHRYNNSGSGNLTAKLRKATSAAGAVVSADVDTVTLVAPPASFQQTARAAAVFTSTGGALDIIGADEMRWFEFTLPQLDMRISMLQVLMDSGP